MLYTISLNRKYKERNCTDNAKTPKIHLKENNFQLNMFCCARQDLKLKSHLERDTKSTAYLRKINLKLMSYLFDSEYPCVPVSLGANVCMDVCFHPV